MTPEERDRRLDELIRMSEEDGLYDDDPPPFNAADAAVCIIGGVTAAWALLMWALGVLYVVGVLK